MRIFFIVSQYVAIFLAGIVGWFGLRTSYKDSSGKVTKQGQRVIIWLIISVLIGFTAYTLNILIENERERQNEQQTMSMLLEIKRAVTKTRIVSIGFDVEIAPNHPDIEKYLTRLRNLEQMRSNSGSYFYEPLYPDWKREATARVVIEQLNFSVWIFKKSEKEQSCPPLLVKQSFNADFTFREHVGITNMFLNHRISPERWWIEVRDINLQSPYVVKNSLDFSKSSQLQSLEDLKGACLVTFLHGREAGLENKVSDIDSVTASSLTVSSIIITLDDGQVIIKNDLQRTKNVDGWIFFSGILPDSL